MIAGLSEADRQRWRERRPLHDLSPSGRYESELQGDSVSLRERASGQGEVRPLPSGQAPERCSVADDGRTLAFSMRDERGQSHLYRSQPGQPPGPVDSTFALYGLDLSPDGNGLAYITLDQVKLQQGESTRTLARLPTMLDEIQYLEDGRLLVQGRASCWSNGSVSTFWLMDEQGQYQFVNDPHEAERLQPGVLSELDAGYKNAFPMADAAQRRELIEQFGYHTPSYRIPSPDKQRMVFSVKPRLEPGDGRAGIYLVQGGQGPARPLPSSRGADLSAVTWRADGRESSLVLTRPNGEAQVCVLGEDVDQASILPYRLDKRETPWSGSGRYLAVQAVVDDMPAIFAFDTQKRSFVPVVTGYQLEGWNGDLLKVSRDGEQLELEPTLLDPRHAPGQIFGSPLPEPGLDPGIRVEPDHVVVGGVRLPRR